MEDAFHTRLKIMHDSVQSYITSAQSVLQERSDSEYISKLRMVESKLKGATERLAFEVCNYSKTVKEPDTEKITQYTLGQIHAEDLIAEISVTIKQNIQDSPTVLASNKNVKTCNKLPKMELARFDGNVLKWYQFWDQFSSNVDSRDISDVDKLLYLQSVLTDDAKQAVEGLDTTNKNYQIAVNTLKERFGKPGAIIDAHYVALYRIKTAHSNQIKDCRQVFDEIERHLRVLSSLGEDVNHNHLRVMIMEKFPEDLIYELKMKMADEEETIDNIRKYLEYIISAKETSNRLKRKSINTDNTDDEITDEGKPISKNITIGTLHAGSEEMHSNKHNRHRHTNFKGDKPKLFSKQFVKPKLHPRKRPLDHTDRNDEPPAKKSKRCVFCMQDHFNDECTKFKTIQERKAQLGNRCYNCFTSGHRAENCRSKRKCRHCNKFGAHNRALCPTKSLQPAQSIPANSLHTTTELNTTLLQTCLVDVTNPVEVTKHTQCRVLLDCGSQRSYITESASKKLGLHIIDRIILSIFTFGAKSPHEIESPTVKFKITTRTGVTRVIYANVVHYITHDIQTPICQYQSDIFNNPELKNLIMADDGSYGSKVDILIGNDYYHSFMNQQKIAVTPDLYLVNSDFGWVWSGKLNRPVDSPDKLTILTYFQSNSVFEDKLTKPDPPLKLNEVKRLWDLESIGITDSPTSSRDEEAVKQFNKTIVLKDNRYHVQWPWTELVPSLSNNLGLVWGRLKSLTRRLDNTELKAYDAVLQEQLRDGIIELVSNPNAPRTHPIHYLPHHCVRHRDKPEKLRIVYDASAKTGDGLSLNECLYRGPLMLEDLTGLLIKFREHPIGIVADVEKAFLQLGLQNQDRDVTRFLWLKDVNREVCTDNILHLRFCRVPFGVISSPFLLNATIRYHLMKSNNNLMKRMAEDIYVDNVVTGTQTISEARNLFKVSRETFGNLSMNLRDWNSNSKEFVAFIPDKFRAHVDDQVKVLGLIWNIHNDYLYLNIKLTTDDLDRVQSKRDVLKTIASIYDPCGLAIPVMLPAKLFFQKLWKEKIKWDVKFNNTLISEWQHIASKFAHLKDIRIERYYSRSLNRDKFSNKIEYELHCFTDSSKEAYAAVIYLRSCLGNNNTISFIIGKSRLVPLKDQDNLQIPKLELLGVLIGYRLINHVMKFVRLNIGKQFLWTDSQVVLNWHQSDKLLPPFVSRRINEIKQNKVLTLRYVPTELNPSDVGTRADRVDSYNIWLNGPDFLRHDSNNWPVYHTNTNIAPTQNLVAGEGLTSNIPTNNSDIQVSDKTEQITVNNSNKSEQEHTNKILDLQAEYFPKEVNDNVTDLSRSLGLFKDQDGVIRCRGRFKHTDLTIDQQEPILLPKNSTFTKEIILNLHQKNYHVGVSHTLALLRQKF
ncbi:uncharacterized protein LOC115448841 [Manduca sexta]|uniref:uncharacterized protein LOC115448841 n=1 Tax=Manduca sexta TaxID=7130 RepID=UPI0018907807|nr:uncharacterized protein LOC115448841 [Manduca sexta]XP_037296553.1 uncharacterized protein LOC115448841 [Manduca sexta]